MTEPRDTESGADARIWVLGSLLYLAGAGACYVMPAFLGESARAFSLSPDTVGLLSGAESLGIMLGSAGASWIGGRRGAGIVLAAAVATIVGDGLTTLVHAATPLIAIRFLTGLVGEGPCYATGFMVLGLVRQVDRAVGTAVTLVMIVASMAMAASGPLTAPVGPVGLMAPFALAALLLIPVAIGLPAGQWSKLSSELASDNAALTTVGRDRAGTGAAIMALVGIGVWFAAPSVFWAFADTAARARGIDGAAVDTALSLAVLCGLTGSAIPVVIGQQLGRVPPIVVSTMGLVVSALMFARADGLIMLAGSLALMNLFWNMAVVYQIAFLADFSDDQRVTGFGAFAQLFGQALGPLVGGVVIAHGGYGVITPLVAIAGGGGLALFTRAASLPRHHAIGTFTVLGQPGQGLN